MAEAIRRARPEDAAALARLHARCFDAGWPESDFAEHIARDLVLIDEGFRGLIVVREGGGQAEVLTLGTDPEARRTGRARALVEAALPHLQAPVLFLEVAEDNAPAIALYRSLGFTSFGRRPNYYRRGTARMAALLMERRLRG